MQSCPEIAKHGQGAARYGARHSGGSKSGAKKLRGSELWRVRVGDYRVLYSIEEVRLLVLVIKIGHRREVYRGEQ